MIRGPKAIARGSAGVVRLAGGGPVVGHLTAWEIVTSPTTGKPTLKGEGRFHRYFLGQDVGPLIAHLTPAPIPAYVGRPKPPPPRPFALKGEPARLTAAALTLASGEYVND